MGDLFDLVGGDEEVHAIDSVDFDEVAEDLDISGILAPMSLNSTVWCCTCSRRMMRLMQSEVGCIIDMPLSLDS